MNISIHRSIITFFFILFILIGCGDGSGTTNTENREYPDGDIVEFIWETNGGGDILFSITHIDNQFEISVERYNFQSVDVVIMVTGIESEVYDLVEDIFNKIVNIYDYTYTPQGDMGTSTKITLKFTGYQEIEIKNIKAANGDLNILYDFVRENTEQVA